MSDSDPGSSEEQKELLWELDDGEYLVESIRARNNIFVPKNTPIFTYKKVSDAKSKKSFKSPSAGIIRINQEILKNGAKLEKGSLLGWIGGECPHEMVLAGSCVTCHILVKRKHDESEGYVSMIHNKPGLMVSKKKATEIGVESRQNLLKARKLILMVDLDQTVIHTTNKAPTQEEMMSNIHSYVLQGFQYHTKIRPHVEEFLTEMSRKFELHVCTYGKREYAEKIVSILDSEKKYFAERVLTRDELRSQHDKRSNLSSLFPAGEEMVLMVDDRCDVWGFSDSLIWVKPYVFFNNIGDINDPNLIRKKAEFENKMEETQKQEASELLNEKEMVDETMEGNEPTESQNEEEEENEDMTNGRKNVDEVEHDDAEEKEDDEGISQDSTTPPPCQIPDGSDDPTLKSISEVLSRIHSSFFQHYDKTGNIAHVRDIAKSIRLSVLKDEIIVFSGLPKYGDLRKHQLVSCVEAFGAVVDEDVTESTTVLVALKARTSKYFDAHRRKIPIVSPKWIEESAAHWKNMEKSEFTDPESLKPLAHCGLPQEITEKAEITTLGRKDILGMEEEVNQFLEDIDDESDGNEETEGTEDSLRKRRASDSECDNPNKVMRMEQEDGNEESVTEEVFGEEDSDSGDGMAADLENLLNN
ncbi:unnamed protein product [Bursaphelenchus xylophilus]|uniref:RNA polymerase II subunit A C-terminal domain phosphatase n=1 Tax=Bursaphelenchus xylophilus TaxID=6326 RepID=A0A1I7RS25_BURXY|nr:unnamed protein product [Bursaphelenchus xylophilus]CAG9123296.1 unnamed protein product [Bursaphelenchus xylophilus]